MTFDGYNFEDAIVISQRLVKEDIFTSIHIEEYDVEIRETKLGREEFTRDIPNVSERALANLDENGVVRVGTRVGPGDILVGKIAPKSKSELTPEEKLLHAIFGRAGEDVKNDSLEMPAGEEGVVINTQRFSRRMHMTDEQKKALKKDIDKYEKEMNQRAIGIFKQMVAEINEVTGQQMVDPGTRQKVGQTENADVILEQIEGFTADWIKGIQGIQGAGRQHLQPVLAARAGRAQGKESPHGTHEARRRTAQRRAGNGQGLRRHQARSFRVGDKMAGRHGNKGVIARIVPEEDMPFLEDGTPVDILLNPLGVPSRMNVGQILETHLGWAVAVLGFQADHAGVRRRDRRRNSQRRRGGQQRRSRTPQGSQGQPHGARPSANSTSRCPGAARSSSIDGRTGEKFEQQTTVGYIYMMKLHHLVDDKIHARATGPYSPHHPATAGRQGPHRRPALRRDGSLGPGSLRRQLRPAGTADGQVRRRRRPHQDLRSMVKGTNTLEAGTPVSFDVLCNEIRGLGLNIQLEKKKGVGREDEDADLM